ncbi:MAG TPA: SurA N-terminal domain-containing protein [Nitrospirota bacterium]
MRTASHDLRAARASGPGSLLRGVLIACACSLLPPAVHAEQLDHIVAAVNHEVITASALAHAVALNMRLGSGREDRSKVEAETLEGLVTGRLLIQEARRLQFVDITDQEIEAERDLLVNRFGSLKALEDFLQEQDMSAGEFNRMIAERLLVERFVEKKVGLFVRVSRDEAQSFFDEHAAQFRGKRFQDVQKEITAYLTDRKIGKQLEQYVAELRGRAELRLNPR